MQQEQKAWGLTSTDGGCRERAALAVESTVPSAAVTDGTAGMPPGMEATAGPAGAGGVPLGALEEAGGSAAAGSGGLKKTGKGDPPIGDPFTSTLS